MNGRADNRACHPRCARIGAWLTVAALAVVFCALALCVGDAEYRATPVGWVALIALMCLIGLSWVSVFVGASGVAVASERTRIDCPRAGEASFPVVLRNDGFLPLFRVDVRFSVVDREGCALDGSLVQVGLAARSSQTCSFRATFSHIGCFRVGVDEVVVHDFLGLFSRPVAVRAACEACVTPRLAAIASMRLDDHAPNEVSRPVKAVLADSMDYAYPRPYVVGDPLKTIHWKLSARTGNYQTRLFEQTVNPGVAVVLDLSAPPDALDAEETRKLFDCVVECGLSVARYAQRQGLELEIHYRNRAGDVSVLNAWDDDAAVRFVESLPVRVDAHDGAALIEHVGGQACRQPNIVVCTANLAEDMLAGVAAARLARRSPFVVAAVPGHVVDRARERYLAPLARLDSLGVGYVALSSADELSGVMA